MQETKEVTINPKSQWECGLECPFLRRYDSTREGTWWCTLYSTKLMFLTEQLLIHRTPKCDGTYLFTMEVPNDESKPATFRG
jgi:hypothetical protein